jgi:phage terminase large subunit-like protein
MTAWMKQIEDVLREIPGYDAWAHAGDSYLDHAAAAKAINWFAEHLKHVEGSSRGEPFVLKRWQAAIVGNLFGWKRKDESGRIVRRYRKSLIFVARGNGKTPLAAGIVLYAFFEDDEPGAQCYLAAGQKEQAGILFRNAKGMVDQDDGLRDAVTIYGGDQHRSIVKKDDQLSFCRVIPADAAGQHGGIPHITVIDELHVQASRELVDVFETAMAKKTRAQPLLVMITTSDYDRPSVCNQTHDYACKVRDGVIEDPAFLPAIYELKPDADWKDEKLWVLANPNLDVSVSREAIRAAIKKTESDPGFENEVRRLHLNMRTTTDVRVISMDQWKACRGEFSEKDLIGQRCYGGLDLASRNDLASFDLIFPRPGGQKPRLLSFSWCPEDRVKWRATRRIPYDVWAKQGWITATAGNRIDHRQIRQDIIALGQKFEIAEIAYDPREATELVQDLQDVDGFKMVEVPQTLANLSAATKDLLSRVASTEIEHDGNPLLHWAASNLALHYQGKVPVGASLLDHLDKVPVMPSKQSSGDKIDPITAAVLAITCMIRNPSDALSSAYETVGLTIL